MKQAPGRIRERKLMATATEEQKDQLLTALRIAIRQINSGDYDVESTIETMPIAAGVNVKGFTRYITGISGIEFSLTRNGLNSTPDEQGPALPQAEQ